MKHSSQLEDIRVSIDQIDKELVALIAKRSKLVEEASKYKSNYREVEDSSRVEVVIDKVRSLAKKQGINEDVVEKIYRNMIGTFIEEEKLSFDRLVEKKLYSY